MDLAELQVFLTVAREGSFSRAAARLYRTQPAVSLAIRTLQDSLGQPLFVLDSDGSAGHRVPGLVRRTASR